MPVRKSSRNIVIERVVEHEVASLTEVHRYVMPDEVITPKMCAEMLGVDHNTLRVYRERHDWVLGVHFTQSAGGRVVYYFRSAIQHWMANQHRPEVHQAWVRAQLEKEEEGHGRIK